jgi:hypothetical protein
MEGANGNGPSAEEVAEAASCADLDECIVVVEED